MASVSGILMREACALAQHRIDVDGAADLLDIAAHDVHATPRPDTLVTLLTVEKPGAKMVVDQRLRHGLDVGLRRETPGDGCGLDPPDVEAASVVGDFDDDVAALMPSGEPQRALLRLAGGAALVRHFDAVVGRVADHVGQRVLDHIEDLPVELGVGTVHLELDRLAELRRQIAHDPRQLLPGIADRLHARLHDAFLQLGGDVTSRQRTLNSIFVPAYMSRSWLRVRHQLRDHGHQVFERVEVDAERLVGDLAVGAVVVAARCRGRHARYHAACRNGRRFLRGRGRRRWSLGRRGTGGRAEGKLELIERNFARTQRAHQHLRDNRADGGRDLAAATTTVCAQPAIRSPSSPLDLVAFGSSTAPDPSMVARMSVWLRPSPAARREKLPINASAGESATSRGRLRKPRPFDGGNRRKMLPGFLRCSILLKRTSHVNDTDFLVVSALRSGSSINQRFQRSARGCTGTCRRPERSVGKRFNLVDARRYWAGRVKVALGNYAVSAIGSRPQSGRKAGIERLDRPLVQPPHALRRARRRRISLWGSDA